jgi:hypothetical protein
MNSLLGRVGTLAVVAGAATLFATGANHVQAADSTKTQTVTAPTCSDQDNLSNPTNSSNKALSSYWFEIAHGGTTTATCSLWGHVKSGDSVTAHFTVASSAAADLEVTLAAYTATEDKNVQALSSCADFSSAADADAATDACTASTTQALTVVVGCNFQIDFVYGEAIQSLNAGQYHSEHRFIQGAVGETDTCTSPSPTSSVSGITTSAPASSSGSGNASGVQAVSTPGTGAGGRTQLLIGIILIALGASAIVLGGRRRAKDI